MSATPAGMSDIRTCTADDIPAVARMFQHAFRDPSRDAPASLERYLRELFLDHPWRDPETTSRVFVGADGQVHGFIGVLPVITTPLTSDPSVVPPAIVVSPAAVDAVPPIVMIEAFENANRPFGVGYDAAARPVEVPSSRPSKLTFSWAIWLSLQENSQSVIFTPV